MCLKYFLFSPQRSKRFSAVLIQDTSLNFQLLGFNSWVKSLGQTETIKKLDTAEVGRRETWLFFMICLDARDCEIDRRVNWFWSNFRPSKTLWETLNMGWLPFVRINQMGLPLRTFAPKSSDVQIFLKFWLQLENETKETTNTHCPWHQPSGNRSLCDEQCCLLLYRKKFDLSSVADFQDIERCHLCADRRNVSSSSAKPSICRAVDSYKERTKIWQ